MANARQFMAARAGAWAKSGKGTVNGFVAAGLTHYWDGIDTGGFGVHKPGTSTFVWEDLIGDVDFSCSSNPNIGDDWVGVSGGDEFKNEGYLYNAVTVQAFRSTIDLFIPIVVFRGSACGIDEWNGHIITTKSVRPLWNKPVSPPYALTAVYDNDGTINADCLSLFSDRLPLTRAAVTEFATEGVCSFKRFGHANAVLVYNRQLTNAEIMANIDNAVKRFGIEL